MGVDFLRGFKGAVPRPALYRFHARALFYAVRNERVAEHMQGERKR